MARDHQTVVMASLQIAGVHCWPQCPFPEVSYLRLLHRHVFHIRAKKVVTHEDRDVEIITLKRDITKFLKDSLPIFKESSDELNFGSMSCETIALLVAKNFELESCSVLEDGENGAEVQMFNHLPI
jgi:hypothetical protein